MVPKTHSSFIDNAMELLKGDCRILGVAVGGSYIYNEMDEYSDIDLVIAVEDGHYEAVMSERFEIVSRLGHLLSAFTGEHVGEPRLVICLYGPPLLHVDFKFVSIKDIEKRVEDPIVLWERNRAISSRLGLTEAKYPRPDLQWIEDRFWVWIHYSAVKIGRGEIFDAIEAISFIRQRAVGPLLLMKNGKLPRGVRKIEFDAPQELPMLKKTIPAYDAQSCVEALYALIELYIDVREYHATEGFIMRTEAEHYSKEFLSEILQKIEMKMDTIKLISPGYCHEAAVMDYKSEFERYDESMDGSGMLGIAKTFDEWFSMLKDNEHEETVREGYVPANTYLAVRVSDNYIVGTISIRLRLNEYLAAYGGHIGYSVRRSERQKGYAKEMLRLALQKCKELGIDKVLVTCDQENVASARTILANGGILENEVPEDGSITQRYWVSID